MVFRINILLFLVGFYHLGEVTGTWTVLDEGSRHPKRAVTELHCTFRSPFTDMVMTMTARRCLNK